MSRFPQLCSAFDKQSGLEQSVLSVFAHEQRPKISGRTKESRRITHLFLLVQPQKWHVYGLGLRFLRLSTETDAFRTREVRCL